MTTKEKFIKLCSLIYLSGDKFLFPFEDLEHDDDLNFISNVNEYKLIVSKMNNFIELLNEEPKNIDKDIESEIYDLI